VIAHHVICGMYGFWLPNDPRGSWSVFVASWELVRFGKATKVDTPRSVAHVPHDALTRRRAKQALKHPPVVLTGRQARAVGRGFAQAAAEADYRIYACSILPEHVHLVVGRHDRGMGQVVGHLKARATQRLKAEGLWPADGHRPWGGKGWTVFLDTPKDLRRAAAYVEANPGKEGLAPQRWAFVRPFGAS